MWEPQMLPLMGQEVPLGEDGWALSVGLLPPLGHSLCLPFMHGLDFLSAIQILQGDNAWELPGINGEI